MSSERTARSFREYLTVKQAAEFLGVSADTLRNWDDSGKLRALRHPVNGYRLYDPEILKALLATTEDPRPGRARRGISRGGSYEPSYE
jgi:excisionase family DNA binding protein